MREEVSLREPESVETLEPFPLYSQGHVDYIFQVLKRIPDKEREKVIGGEEWTQFQEKAEHFINKKHSKDERKGIGVFELSPKFLQTVFSDDNEVLGVQPSHLFDLRLEIMRMMNQDFRTLLTHVQGPLSLVDDYSRSPEILEKKIVLIKSKSQDLLRQRQALRSFHPFLSRSDRAFSGKIDDKSKEVFGQVKDDLLNVDDTYQGYTDKWSTTVGELKKQGHLTEEQTSTLLEAFSL